MQVRRKAKAGKRQRAEKDAADSDESADSSESEAADSKDFSEHDTSAVRREPVAAVILCAASSGRLCVLHAAALTETGDVSKIQ